MNANDILHHKLTIPVATGVVSFGVGFFIGQKYITKSLRDDIEAVNRQTDELMASIVAVKEAKDAEELPQPELDEDDEVLKYDGTMESLRDDDIPSLEEEVAPEVEFEGPLHQPETEVTVNVFEREDAEGWVWAEELAQRAESPGLPYTIHVDEFIHSELDYNQETLTYYMGDDVLTDTEDTPIYNYTGMMGELKFGHGSKDPNIVYIRNDDIHMEWEILRHKGSYEIEVLGHTIEKDYEESDLKHSKISKFRQE